VVVTSTLITTLLITDIMMVKWCKALVRPKYVIIIVLLR
jgi:hypothetical protein